MPAGGRGQRPPLGGAGGAARGETRPPGQEEPRGVQRVSDIAVRPDGDEGARVLDAKEGRARSGRRGPAEALQQVETLDGEPEGHRQEGPGKELGRRAGRSEPARGGGG